MITDVEDRPAVAARRVLAGSVVGAGLLWASAAGANQVAEAPTGPAAVSGVTVTAPEKPSPLIDRTTEFVRQRLPTSRFEQYARFRDPVCVKVIGLPDEFAAFVTKRIVEVAAEVHAPVAKDAGCAPNINVIFAPTPQAQLTDIAKRREVLFGHYFKADAKRTFTFRPPVQSWYLTRAVGTDGRGVLELNDTAPCQGTGLPGAPPCDLKAPPLTGRAGSRLGNDMSSELVHSLIIADAKKVSGEKIGAVADYIAVLSLSRWQGLERCSSMSTILNLMADGCDADVRPEAVTSADLALLSGLYSVDPRESGSLQRASIASAIRKAAAPDKDRR